MKHAFLILAHTNFSQLQRLLTRLDAENHSFFVHMDGKVEPFDPQRLHVEKGKLTFLRGIPVYWGHHSVVNAELYLFRTALADSDAPYDYYHLISGMDYPLQTNEAFDAFFEKHAGKEFVDVRDVPSVDVYERVSLYHFLEKDYQMALTKLEYGIIKLTDKVSLSMQRLFKTDRTKNNLWKCMFGSQWASVTHEFADCMSSERTELQRLLVQSHCGDEMMFQTTAFNCGFKDAIFEGLERVGGFGGESGDVEGKGSPVDGNASVAAAGAGSDDVCGSSDMSGEGRKGGRGSENRKGRDSEVLHGVSSFCGKNIGNVRYFRLPKTGKSVHPIVFTKSDFEELKQASEQGFMFARKLDETVDKDILDLIDQHILGVSGASE